MRRETQIILGSLIIIVGLVCWLISNRIVLSNKEQQELQELNNEVNRLYGGND